MTGIETNTRCKRKYSARFAECDEDVRRAQALRSARFLAGGGSGGGVDVDDFDHASRHVLVEEDRTGILVCCYRLRLFERASDISQSYSAQY